MFAHTEEPSEVGTASGNRLQPKFSTVDNLKTSTRLTRNACFPLVTAHTHALFVFHWPCSHPHDACFSLATPYIHAILVFHWPWFTPMQYLSSIGHSLHPHIACFPVIILLILSTVGCICRQHQPGSSQVKVVYHIGRLNGVVSLVIL